MAMVGREGVAADVMEGFARGVLSGVVERAPENGLEESVKVVAIVVIDWTHFARVIRAEAMAQGAMDYVASAQVAGRTRLSTMVTEILPDVLPTISVVKDNGDGSALFELMP